MVNSVIITVTVLFMVMETAHCAYFYTEKLQNAKFVVRDGRVPDNVQWFARLYISVKDLNRTGWGYLEVETRDSEPDVVQAYQAGFLEGVACSDLIYNYWEKMIVKSGVRQEDYYGPLMKFIDANTQWVLNGIKSNQKFGSWLQLCLLYKQIEGIVKGVRQTKPHANITFSDFILLHAIEELPEILCGLGLREPRVGLDFGTVIARRVNCKNETNILVLHSKPYTDHIRFQKKYILPFSTQGSGLSQTVPGKIILFTSPPGIVTAEDGFYMSSANIIVSRTSIDTAYKVEIFPSSGLHLGFLRAYIATRLANTTRHWFSELCAFRGSTYNSEYILIDYERVLINLPKTPADAVVFAYDVPGFRRHVTVGHDVKTGKGIMSINVPKNMAVYHLTNQERNVVYHGSLYSHSNSPRILKIRVFEDTIENLDDLLRVGQFNMTTDLLPKMNGTITANFYPKTVIYTKLLNRRLYKMFNFVIYGYPHKGIVFEILPSITSQLSVVE